MLQNRFKAKNKKTTCSIDLKFILKIICKQHSRDMGNKV